MRGEVVINGVTFISGCLLYYVATTIPQLRVADKVGPAFWPKAILSLIILLSGSLLIKSLVILFKRKQARPREFQDSQREWTLRLLVTIALSLLYGFTVSYGGFLLSVYFFQLIQLSVLKVKRVWILFLFPFLMTIVYYLIFIKALHIPLPKGMGIFLQFSRLFY